MKNLIPAICFIIFLSRCSTKPEEIVMTVNGPIPAREMGVSLTHEHILVDFIGADSISEQRWDKSKVIARATPFLKQISDLGCKTLVECTPAYLGRDPLILRFLSYSTGINIITNTGYYGAANDKFIPRKAYELSANQIAGIWINEWYNGIEETVVKPGFIKIGVDNGSLSEIDRKLVVAAALTHLETGLTIASHTGPAVPAFEQLDILKKEGVSPEAFIWVHAQSEKDPANRVKAAKMGAWISLDGLNDNNLEEYVVMLKNMKENKLLNKVLLSHDAGWYHPGEENGGEYRGYTTLFQKLIPLLEKEKFSARDIYQLTITNPAKAFAVKIRKYK